MPDGTMDFGESLVQCAVREVREETGFNIEISGLIGTYTDPDGLIAYSDGEIRQEFALVYAAKIKNGELTIDHESKEAVWVSIADGLSLPLAGSQQRRLQGVARYRESPTTFLR